MRKDELIKFVDDYMSDMRDVDQKRKKTVKRMKKRRKVFLQAFQESKARIAEIRKSVEGR